MVVRKQGGVALERALEKAGISRSTYYARRQKGMSFEEALKVTPAKRDERALREELAAVGLSRSAYYYRRKKGMSHEEAVHGKKHNADVPPNSGSEAYSKAVAYAVDNGLLTKEQAPSWQTFAKARKKGLPSKLAIIAIERLDLERKAQLVQLAAEVGADDELFIRMAQDTVFVSGLKSMLKHADILTPDQRDSVVLHLTQRAFN